MSDGERRSSINQILQLHEGGKIAISSRVDLDTVSDLEKVYTPGVATICRNIVENPSKAVRYTAIPNTVAIITNGTAILGLGDIGPVAGMPVMEGKSVLFDKLVGISAIPILIDSKDPQEIIETVKKIALTFGAILLEDIASPACFYVERQLQLTLDIPVFHDDQHGSAVVILAGMLNALRLVGRGEEELSIVINGAGAAGLAVARALVARGVEDIVLCDRAGAIYEGRREHMNEFKDEISKLTNRQKRKGSLADVIKGSNFFIGLSGPRLLSEDMIRTMRKGSIIFALANPIPEIWPTQALKTGAAYAIDGRFLNNALAFPGIFRGALDARARTIDDEMKVAAVNAIVSHTEGDQIVPDLLNLRVHQVVAKAVKEAAKSSGATATYDMKGVLIHS